MQNDQLLDVVGGIYEAATDAQLWPRVLAKIAEITRATVIGLPFFENITSPKMGAIAPFNSLCCAARAAVNAYRGRLGVTLVLVRSWFGRRGPELRVLTNTNAPVGPVPLARGSCFHRSDVAGVCPAWGHSKCHSSLWLHLRLSTQTWAAQHGSVALCL
jgi:hypothetical protein